MNFGWEGVHNSVHNHLPESILQAQEVRGHSLLLLLSQLRVQSPLPISMLVMVVFLFLKKEKWWYRKFIGMNAGSLIKKKSEKGSSRQKKKESRGLDSWQFYSVGSLCWALRTQARRHGHGLPGAHSLSSSEGSLPSQALICIKLGNKKMSLWTPSLSKRAFWVTLGVTPLCVHLPHGS